MFNAYEGVCAAETLRSAPRGRAPGARTPFPGTFVPLGCARLHAPRLRHAWPLRTVRSA